MKWAANQLLISTSRGNVDFYIWSATRDNSPETAIFDMNVFERAMREIG